MSKVIHSLVTQQDVLATLDRNSAEDRRRWLRRAEKNRATLHAAEQARSTLITDISAGGAGLDGAIGVLPGDKIEVGVVCGRQISGEVIWWITGCCGVKFN
jgi:hypothetical protein